MDKQLKNLIKTVLLLIIVIIIFNICPIIKDIILLVLQFLLPFIVGFTIAFLLNPLVDYLETKKFNRKIISLLILCTFTGIVILLFIWVSPILVKEITKLVNNFPEYIDNINSFLDKISQKFNLTINNSHISINTIIDMMGVDNDKIFNMLGTIIQGTFSYAFVLVLSFILSLYFLIDFNKIVDLLKKYLLKKEKEDLFPMFKELKKNMYSYLGGLIFVMVFLILISTLSFWIIGLSMPLLWGVIIGLTNIIPYIGPYVGGVVVALFTIGSLPEKIIPVILIIVVLQLLESNFITPKVESKTVKVHPILAIFSVTLFGKILGIFGMILAVPIVSSLQIFLKYKKYN